MLFWDCLCLCNTYNSVLITSLLGRSKETAGDDIYQGAISRSVARMEHDEENGMEPRIVAHLVCRLCLQRKVRPLYTVGALYKFFVFLARVLPKSLVNFILGKMYA